MPKLLLIPLEDTVVFPGMEVTLPVDPGDETQVLLVPRHESDYATVGVVAEVGERMRLPGRIRAVQLSALHRGVPMDAFGHGRAPDLHQLEAGGLIHHLLVQHEVRGSAQDRGGNQSRSEHRHVLLHRLD